MSTGYRFRAHPSDQVAGVLLRWIGCQRYVYNAKVREDRYFRAFQRKALALPGQYPPVDQQYSHLIGDGNGSEQADTHWLREVPSHVLRNGAVRFYQGYQRFFKKLARRPTIQSRHGEQSVWLTSELFEFKPVLDKATGEIIGQRLFLGTKKFPCGELAFVNHRPGWKVPASIHISVHACRWHLSFSNEADAGSVAPSEKDVLDYLRQHSFEELCQKTIALDLGVAIPLMTSEGEGFAFDEIQQHRMARKEIQRKRWQRRMSRRREMGKAAARKAGVRYTPSKNCLKAKARAAKTTLYAADVRKDFAHQVSRQLVDGPQCLFVFEALGIRNMTRSAAGTVDAPGKNVAAKSGLNKAILGSAWGSLKLFTKYKALEAGKLCIELPPHYSSQECAACGHIHPDNRHTQSRFICKRCEHSDNADHNAAKVLAKRACIAIASGSFALRTKKKVGSLRGNRASASTGPSTVGPERSECTPVETSVSHEGPRPLLHVSLKQETPTTAPCA